MLSKEKRLPRKMFPLLAKGAKISRDSLFLFRFINSPQSHSRFAFSVSKKVAKNANLRNRLRRFGYRVVAQNFAEIKNGYLINFSFLRQPHNDKEITESILSVLRRNNILKS